MIKRLKARHQLKKAIKIKTPRKAIGPRVHFAIQMCVLVIGLTFSQIVIIFLKKWFQEQLPNDNQWSVAFIALPVAFFAIWVSTHLALLQKEQTIFVDSFTVSDILKRIKFWYDFRPSAVVLLSSNLLLWINTFISKSDDLKSAKLIAYSLLMLFDCLYLILIDLVYIGTPVHKLFVKFFISNYNFEDREIDTNKAKSEKIKKGVLDHQDNAPFESFGNELSGNAGHSFRLLIVSICDGTGTDAQKSALLSLMQEVSKKQFTNNNAVLTTYLIKICKDVFCDCLNKSNLAFSSELFQEMFSLYFKKTKQFFSFTKKISSIYNETLKYFSNYKGPECGQLKGRETKQLVDAVTQEKKNQLLACIAFRECEQSIYTCAKMVLEKKEDYPQVFLNCFLLPDDDYDTDSWSSIINELQVDFGLTDEKEPDESKI